jgi:hypothetical protein
MHVLLANIYTQIIKQMQFDGLFRRPDRTGSETHAMLLAEAEPSDFLCF